MAMTMMLGSAVSASALDTGTYPADTNTGSITVHKYKTDQASSTAGTGLDNQAVPTGAVALEGAGFTIYKLDTAKVEGQGAAAATGAPTAATLDTFKTTYGATQVGTEQTTGVDGKTTFTGLTLGYYLLVETTTPTGVSVSPAAPSIVTLPYKYDGNYNKDVHVYPKNVTNTPVEKKLTSANVNVAGANASLSYDITTKFPATLTRAQLRDDGQTPVKYASFVMTDTPTYVTDSTGAKHSVMDLATGYPTATIYAANIGKVADWDATQVANYFTKSTSADGASTIWTINNAGIDALVALFNGTDINPVSSIVMHTSYTTNDYVLQLPLKEGVKNTVTVDSKSSSGATLVDPSTPAVTPELPTVAFDFAKMELNDTQTTASLLLPANYSNVPTTWSLATSPTNATNKVYLKNAAGTNLSWTQDANGIVSVSGLATVGLTNNGATYTDVQTALANAKTNGSASVNLWLVETSAPNAFNSLGSIPITLTIHYASATDTYSVTTTGGNIDSGKTWATSANAIVADTASATPVAKDFGVVNAKPGQSVPSSFSLPNTGGMGTILFAVIGAVLIAAGCFYFLRRRNRQED